MGRRDRTGHRNRGHEGTPSSDGERTLVLPGDEIPAGGLRPGSGTYRVHGRIYASILGLLRRRPPFVQVVPLSGRYIPKPGDVVIGTVTDVQGTFWLLDIGAPRWAPLHMTGTPWKIDFGETKNYLRVKDSVVVQVESIENSGRIGVTMLGEGLGKLEGGSLVTISPAKVPRLIGRGGSMISTIQRLTGCRLTVGQNGRVHVEGSAEESARVRETLRLIDDEGHRPGLTERVHGFLEPNGPSDDGGRRAASPVVAHPAPDAHDHPIQRPPPGEEIPEEEVDEETNQGPSID